MIGLYSSFHFRSTSGPLPVGYYLIFFLLPLPPNIECKLVPAAIRPLPVISFIYFLYFRLDCVSRFRLIARFSINHADLVPFALASAVSASLPPHFRLTSAFDWQCPAEWRPLPTPIFNSQFQPPQPRFKDVRDANKNGH